MTKIRMQEKNYKKEKTTNRGLKLKSGKQEHKYKTIYVKTKRQELKL